MARIRTQVYFDKEDYEEIGILAAQRGVSKAEMTRRVVKAGVKEVGKKKQKGKLTAAEAMLKLGELAIHGPGDMSETMDDYLYGDKSKFAEKK